MPSGQLTLFYVFKMLANINKNEVSVWPLDSQPCFTSPQMLANINKNEISVRPLDSQPCFKTLQIAYKYYQKCEFCMSSGQPTLFYKSSKCLQILRKWYFCMPSGQPTLFYKSSKCLQILTKMRFLYALWTANLVSQVLKLLADINKNEISVCPLGFFRDDFSTLLERF